jgi:hypothetical protein
MAHATRRNASTCRSHASSRFQLARMRLTILRSPAHTDAPARRATDGSARSRIFPSPSSARSWQASIGGSIEPRAAVRDALGEEQLLQALLVVQRRLDPQIRGARQDAFCERQDALDVEFVHLLGVLVDLRERQFLAQP